MNSKLSQNIAELETYGYTILKNAIVDHSQYLNRIKALSEKELKENKMWDESRSLDTIIYNLQNKDEVFVHLLMHEEIQEILKYFLNDNYYQVMSEDKPNFILNYYNARSSGKFLDLHIDSSVPAHGEHIWAMQVAFVLESSNEENGCTVVVPGSHQSGKYTNRGLVKRVPLTASPGDILIWDSRIWHGTLDNISGRSRWMLIATFTRWWLKQSMDITRGLPNVIYQNLSEAEKLLMGFCSIPPANEKGSIHTKKVIMI